MHKGRRAHRPTSILYPTDYRHSPLIAPIGCLGLGLSVEVGRYAPSFCNPIGCRYRGILLGKIWPTTLVHKLKMTVECVPKDTLDGASR